MICIVVKIAAYVSHWVHICMSSLVLCSKSYTQHHYVVAICQTKACLVSIFFCSSAVSRIWTSSICFTIPLTSVPFRAMQHNIYLRSLRRENPTHAHAQTHKHKTGGFWYICWRTCVRACVRVDFPSGDHISSIIQCQFVFMNIHKVFKGGASKREKRNRRSEVCIYRER